jgi:hypothetical protein
MKIYEISFKNEAIWSMILALVTLALGAFAALVIYLVRLV